MLNLDFLEKGLVPVSSTHFEYDFSRNAFLVLRFILRFINLLFITIVIFFMMLTLVFD